MSGATVDFDAIVVGAGRAGTAAAYKLASDGFDVALIERSKQPGMKNVTGGVLYGEVLDELVPEFPEKAPLERHVVEHNIQLLNDDSEIGISFRDPTLTDEPNYTLMLGKFDRWFVDKAKEQGVVFIPETTVRDITQQSDHVSVKTDRKGGSLTSNIVIGGDGVNTTVGRKTGIRRTMRNDDMALSVKQVINLDEETINERFNLNSGEGAAYVYTGYPEGAATIGYFLYTYESRISVGAVGGLEVLSKIGEEGYGNKGTPLYSLLDQFKQLPTVKPLVRGGDIQEYQGILIPELSYEELPARQDRRVCLIGDAAGLVMNKGYTFRGLDYGIKSGLTAADAVARCASDGDWDAFGSRYDAALEDTYVLKEMRQHKHLPSFLRTERLYDAYPELAANTLHSMFSTSADAEGLTWRQAWDNFRSSDLRVRDLVRDGFRAFRSM
jgi:electron transfer flavoprotein-quinone oxidoreductase